MRRYEGKVVIVTGGASGIGAAIARRLSAEGASVVVSDLEAGAAREVADGLGKDGGRAIAVAANVAEEEAVRDLVDRAVAELGGLDVMVNNAGVGESATPIEDKSAADWRRVIDIDLTGVFLGVKHAARAMKARGRGGAIINMASVLGVVGFNGAPAYCAAKHGVVGLT
ncbi:MAG TPA: SDR family NAD(P)-dependent oxidoreductase, partial [Gemmatimonadaceae bacterium]|nr:SDR family NAD(P)-dependent oxidoreductase [Gemmatimonadaceae bacterium]